MINKNIGFTEKLNERVSKYAIENCESNFNLAVRVLLQKSLDELSKKNIIVEHDLDGSRRVIDLDNNRVISSITKDVKVYYPSDSVEWTKTITPFTCSDELENPWKNKDDKSG